MAEPPTALEQLCEQADLPLDEVLRLSKEEWIQLSRSIFRNNALSHASMSRERFLLRKEILENDAAGGDAATGDSAVVSSESASNNSDNIGHGNVARGAQKKRSRSTNQRNSPSKKAKTKKAASAAIARAEVRPDRVASANHRQSKSGESSLSPSVQTRSRRSNAGGSVADQKLQATRASTRLSVRVSKKAPPPQQSNSVPSMKSGRALVSPQKRTKPPNGTSPSSTSKRANTKAKKSTVRPDIPTSSTVATSRRISSTSSDQRRVYQIDVDHDKIIVEYENMATVAHRFCMPESAVEDWCTGKVARIGGLYLRFADDYNKELAMKTQAKPRRSPPFADVSIQFKPAQKQSTKPAKRAAIIKEEKTALPDNTAKVVPHTLIPRCEWTPDLYLKKMQRFVPGSRIIKDVYSNGNSGIPTKMRDSLFAETIWPELLRYGWKVRGRMHYCYFTPPSGKITLSSRAAVLRHVAIADPWKNNSAIRAAISVFGLDHENREIKRNLAGRNSEMNGVINPSSHYYLDCSKEFCLIRSKKLACGVDSTETEAIFEQSGWTSIEENANARSSSNNKDTPTRAQPLVAMHKSSPEIRALHKDSKPKDIAILKSHVESKKKLKARWKEKMPAVDLRHNALLPKTKWRPNLYLKRMQRHVPRSEHLARFHHMNETASARLGARQQLFIETVWSVLLSYGWKAVLERNSNRVGYYISPLDDTSFTNRYDLLCHVATDSRWNGKSDVQAAVSTLFGCMEEQCAGGWRHCKDGKKRSIRKRTSRSFCRIRMKQTGDSDAMTAKFTEGGWAVEILANLDERNLSNVATADTSTILQHAELQAPAFLHEGPPVRKSNIVLLFKEALFPQKQIANKMAEKTAILKSLVIQPQKPRYLPIASLVPQHNWQPDCCLRRMQRYIPSEEKMSRLEQSEQLMRVFRSWTSILFCETVWKVLASYGWAAFRTVSASNHCVYETPSRETSLLSRAAVIKHVSTNKDWKEKHDIQAALAVFITDTESQQILREVSARKLVAGNDNICHKDSRPDLNCPKVFSFVRLKVKDQGELDDFKMNGWSLYEGTGASKAKSGLVSEGEWSPKNVAIRKDEAGVSPLATPKLQRVPSKRMRKTGIPIY